MIWTLVSALPFIQALERELLDNEAGAHCALGGSVLHKGASEKDLDVFIYAHQVEFSEAAVVALLEELYGAKLEKLGFEYDCKTVYKLAETKTRGRVDFFFLSTGFCRACESRAEAWPEPAPGTANP